MICFDLPLPVGVNNMYPTVQTAEGPRRVKSKAYKAWLADAGWSVPPAAKGKVPGHFRAFLIFDRPEAKARVDLDGKVKAVMDLLTKSRVIVDDSLAERIVLDWSSPFTAPVFPKIPLVHVTIEPLTEAST